MAYLTGRPRIIFAARMVSTICDSGLPFSAEPAAGIGGKDLDVIGQQAQERRQQHLRGQHTLIGIPHGQPGLARVQRLVLAPLGDQGVGFQRVVVMERVAVGLIDAVGCLVPCRCRIAARVVARLAIDLSGDRQIGRFWGEFGLEGLRLAGDIDQRRRLARGDRVIGNDRADELAVKADPRRLQHLQRGVIGHIKARRVLVGHHQPHARQGLGGAAVDGGDFAQCDWRGDRPQIQRVLDRVLIGIGRRAAGLQRAFDPAARGADILRIIGAVHGRPPARSVRTAVMAFKSIGRL